jgi:hypothetical protein
MSEDNWKMYSKPYESDGKWNVDVANQDGEVLNTEKFDDELSAKNWIRDEALDLSFDTTKPKKEKKVKKPKQSAKDAVRESLKDFIDDEEEQKLLDSLKDGNKLPMADENNLPAFNQVEPFDFTEVKSKGDQKARRLMDSMLKLYLSQELIDKQEYVRAKTKYDQLTLSQLYQQMMVSEHAIEAMVRAIDRGESHPRMFEVLGGLQSRMLDIMKHQTLHMMAAEENLKKIKHDIDIYAPKQIEAEDANIIEDDSKSDNLTRGSRETMKNLQRKIAEQKGEKFISDDDE